MLCVGVAFNALANSRYTLRRAVTMFAYGRRAKHLYEHRIVNIRAERIFDGIQVCPVPIGRDLHPVTEPRSEIGDKAIGCVGRSVAKRPGQNKLAISIHPNPKPHIASLGTPRGDFSGAVLILATNANAEIHCVTLEPSSIALMPSACMMPQTRGNFFYYLITRHGSREGPRMRGFDDNRREDYL